MSDKILCFVGVGVGLAVLVYVVYLLRSRPAAPIFDGWQDIFAAKRDARDLFEFLIFLALLARHLFRGGSYLIAITVISSAVSLGSSMCGIAPEAWPQIRGIVDDILDFLARLLRLPPAPAPASPTP